MYNGRPDSRNRKWNFNLVCTRVHHRAVGSLTTWTNKHLYTHCCVLQRQQVTCATTFLLKKKQQRDGPVHQLGTSKHGLFSNSHPLLPNTSGCFYFVCFFFSFGAQQWQRDSLCPVCLFIFVFWRANVRECTGTDRPTCLTGRVLHGEKHREKDTFLPYFFLQSGNSNPG